MTFLQILFWVLYILCAIGVFIPDAPDRPWSNRARWVVTLILVGILGYVVLGGSIHR